MQQDRLNLKQWRNREDGLGQDRKRKNMRPKLPMLTVGVTTLAAAEFEHHRKELPVEATGDRDTAAPAPGACVRFGCMVSLRVQLADVCGFPYISPQPGNSRSQYVRG